MEEPSVLVGTVLADVKDDCLFINRKDYNNTFNFFDNILSLSYPNYDFYCVDNSKNPGYHKKIKEQGIDCDYYDPKELTSREILTDSYNMIRDRFLGGKYDKLLTVECDLEIPHDTIYRLISHELPIVGFCYTMMKGEKIQLLLQQLDNYTSGGLRIPVNLSLGDQMDFMDGSVKPAGNIGTGCLLIDKEIANKIRFRIDDTDIGFHDEFFSRDVLKSGEYIWVDTSYIVKHYFTGVWDIISENKHIVRKAS